MILGVQFTEFSKNRRFFCDDKNEEIQKKDIFVRYSKNGFFNFKI